MAKTALQAVPLPPFSPDFSWHWYYLMDDGTMWYLTANGYVWSQLPDLPLAQTPLVLNATSGQDDPQLQEYIYVTADDGKIYQSTSYPYSWVQISNTPP